MPMTLFDSWAIGLILTLTKKQIDIYTDGSCLGNPGPGGWAALLKFQGKEKLIVGKQTDTTNNRMELTAVIEALKCLRQPCDIELYTDSKYVMDGATVWMPNWHRNGWLTSHKKPVKNAELWQQLEEQMQSHRINWHWVKGHAGHIENERVDDAARAQAELLL